MLQVTAILLALIFVTYSEKKQKSPTDLDLSTLGQCAATATVLYLILLLTNFIWFIDSDSFSTEHLFTSGFVLLWVSLHFGCLESNIRFLQDLSVVS